MGTSLENDSMDGKGNGRTPKVRLQRLSIPFDVKMNHSRPFDDFIPFKSIPFESIQKLTILFHSMNPFESIRFQSIPIKSNDFYSIPFNVIPWLFHLFNDSFRFHSKTIPFDEEMRTDFMAFHSIPRHSMLPKNNSIRVHSMLNPYHSMIPFDLKMIPFHNVFHGLQRDSIRVHSTILFKSIQ